MAALDDLQAQVAALQAEDGVVVSALNDLKAKADAGSVTAADVENVTSTVQAEVQKLSDAVSATDPDAVPPPSNPPTTGTTDTTGGGTTGSTDTGSTGTTDTTGGTTGP